MIYDLDISQEDLDNIHNGGELVIDLPIGTITITYDEDLV